MGLFDMIFGRKPTPRQQAQGVFKTLTAYQPSFSTWRGSIYESELVRAAINARSTHISKLEVSIQGTPSRLLTRLKHAPNEWMTWGQFLYRLNTILDVHNTAFIVPVTDRYGDTVGLYPILPARATIVQYNGTPYLRYEFKTGQFAAIEYSQCGVLTKHQLNDDFFGESNAALEPTMELVSMQNQGISEGVRSAATYRFSARLTNFSKPEDIAKERKRFTADNLSSGSEADGGILLFPHNYEDIRQIDSKPFIVDAAQMDLIRTNVYNYFGVNQDILQNAAIGDKWSAFYEGAIEPTAIQISDVVTRMLFTSIEQTNGSRFMLTSNRLQFMSNSDKLAISADMADRGLMTRNEIRAIWNLPPLDPEIGDTLPVRGEYYNIGEEKQDE